MQHKVKTIRRIVSRVQVIQSLLQSVHANVQFTNLTIQNMDVI